MVRKNPGHDIKKYILFLKFALQSSPREVELKDWCRKQISLQKKMLHIYRTPIDVLKKLQQSWQTMYFEGTIEYIRPKNSFHCAQFSSGWERTGRFSLTCEFSV